jgi:K+-transporting ATPase ATPase C chain
MLQVKRVAAARQVDPAVVEKLVRAHTEGRTFGVLGEPRINVLLLNVDLDKQTPG